MRLTSVTWVEDWRSLPSEESSEPTAQGTPYLSMSNEPEGSRSPREDCLQDPWL